MRDVRVHAIPFVGTRITNKARTIIVTTVLSTTNACQSIRYANNGRTRFQLCTHNITSVWKLVRTFRFASMTLLVFPVIINVSDLSLDVLISIWAPVSLLIWAHNRNDSPSPKLLLWSYLRSSAGTQNTYEKSIKIRHLFLTEKNMYVILRLKRHVDRTCVTSDEWIRILRIW